jgi:hypothetical protein
LSVTSNFGTKPCFLEKLAHQPQGCSGTSAALYQHIEDPALVVDGAPEVHSLAGDPDHHFV